MICIPEFVQIRDVELVGTNLVRADDYRIKRLLRNCPPELEQITGVLSTQEGSQPITGLDGEQAERLLGYLGARLPTAKEYQDIYRHALKKGGGLLRSLNHEDNQTTLWEMVRGEGAKIFLASEGVVYTDLSIHSDPSGIDPNFLYDRTGLAGKDKIGFREIKEPDK